MKRILLFAILLISPLSILLAQEVDVNKETNMVQVDGKDAFYLTPKNKQLMSCDFSLENLQHKELAYLKHTSYGKETAFYVVFSKSGNQCTLTGFGSFGGVKHLAKIIAGAGLVQDNAMSPDEERKFIILHHGTFIQDPASIPPPPPTEHVAAAPANNNAPRPSAGPADISIKDNNIYNNSEMVGVFKRASDGGITTVSIYNANDAMICKATHPDNNENADWTLVLDGKTVTLLYNAITPMEKLFKYLAEKGYL